MWRIKLAGIALGAFLAFWGFNENKLNSNMTSEPEKVTMAELEKGGYSGSNYVEISDFYNLNFQLVYSAKVGKYDKDVKEDSTVEYCYIPIISKENPFVEKVDSYLAQVEAGGEAAQNIPEPSLDSYSVLVKTDRYKKVGDLPYGFDEGAALQGVFINKITSLADDEKDLLLEGASGIDLENILILEEGRTPSSATKAYGAMAGGVVIALLSLLWLIKPKN